MHSTWQYERFVHGDHRSFVFWLSFRNLHDPQSAVYFVPTLESLTTVEECEVLIKEAEDFLADWTDLLHPNCYTLQLRRAKIDLLYKRIFDINSISREKFLLKTTKSFAQATSSTTPSYTTELPEPNPKRQKIVFKGGTDWNPWP